MPRRTVYEIIDYIKQGHPVMREDVEHDLGITRARANRNLKELYMLDLIHICGWDKTYQQWVPVYKWGNKPDVEKPAPITRAEALRRWRKRSALRQQRSQGPGENQGTRELRTSLGG